MNGYRIFLDRKRNFRKSISYDPKMIKVKDQIKNIKTKNKQWTKSWHNISSVWIENCSIFGTECHLRPIYGDGAGG